MSPLCKYRSRGQDRVNTTFQPICCSRNVVCRSVGWIYSTQLSATPPLKGCLALSDLPKRSQARECDPGQVWLQKVLPKHSPAEFPPPGHYKIASPLHKYNPTCPALLRHACRITPKTHRWLKINFHEKLRLRSHSQIWERWNQHLLRFDK